MPGFQNAESTDALRIRVLCISILLRVQFFKDFLLSWFWNPSSDPESVVFLGFIRRINKEFGREGYEPVVLLERHVPLYERVAFYTLAEACVVTAVRDGMNLIPYEYIVCREGGGGGAGSGGGDTPPMSVGVGVNRSTVGSESKKSMLVVSEFIGCSPSLSGAIRVNPWNTEAVAEAMNAAITMPHTEQRMRHEKHYRYVATHTVTYWAQSYMSDLERTCK